MRLISWNVNGLRACEGKGFSDIFRELDADFFCLQETKMQEGQLDLQFEGYTSYWNYAEKKGYSGTAIFTKHQPLNVEYGIGIDLHDHEGRVITLEMQDFFLVCKASIHPVCLGILQVYLLMGDIQVTTQDNRLLGIESLQVCTERIFP